MDEINQIRELHQMYVGADMVSGWAAIVAIVCFFVGIAGAASYVRNYKTTLGIIADFKKITSVTLTLLLAVGASGYGYAKNEQEHLRQAAFCDHALGAIETGRIEYIPPQLEVEIEETCGSDSLYLAATSEGSKLAFRR